MADHRTRTYNPHTTATPNGSSPTASRERIFNDIFSTGRPMPNSSGSQPSMNGNGTGLGSSGLQQTKPGYVDGRTYHPPPRHASGQHAQSYVPPASHSGPQTSPYREYQANNAYDRVPSAHQASPIDQRNQQGRQYTGPSPTSRTQPPLVSRPQYATDSATSPRQGQRQ